MQPKMIAEVAYSVYAKMTDNKNVRGEDLPLFQDLGDKIQNAWIAAVQAVRNPKLSDLADRPLVDAFDRLRLAAGDPYLQPEHGETVEIALIDHVIDKLAGANGVVAA
jgi:hypothetical protein